MHVKFTAKGLLPVKTRAQAVLADIGLSRSIKTREEAVGLLEAALAKYSKYRGDKEKETKQSPAKRQKLEPARLPTGTNLLPWKVTTLSEDGMVVFPTSSEILSFPRQS